MAEIGSWNGHSFVVSPTMIRSFTGLTITGSSEIEDKTSDGQKYVSRKSGNPSEISLTVELNAFTGCDVQNDALAFVEEARNGAKNYFYLGGKKLLTCQLMLTEATVNETHIAPGGNWISCKVNLTMKQCSKNDRASAASSKKTDSIVKTAVSGAVTGVMGIVSGIKKTANTEKKAGALEEAAAAVRAAQQTSSLTKKTTVKNKITVGSVKVKSVVAME